MIRRFVHGEWAEPRPGWPRLTPATLPSAAEFRDAIGADRLAREQPRGTAAELAGRVFLPESASKFIEANQMAILGGCFLCNMIAGNLLNTGAFEITYDGVLVWSKIETGRFPQLAELTDVLKEVMSRGAQQ